MNRFLVFFVLCVPYVVLATTVAPPPCKTPLSELPTAPDIRIDQPLTSCSVDTCTVSIVLDKEVEGFQFKEFWLERKEAPMFGVQLATKNRDTFETVWFDGDHQFFNNLLVHAGYSNGKNCSIVSTMEITHNKKRNALDATIVAPIR